MKARTLRSCCGCGHENDATQAHCLRCHVPLPQTPGTHYINIALLPTLVGRPDPIADNPFYRNPRMRSRFAEYNRRWGNPNRPGADRPTPIHPESDGS